MRICVLCSDHSPSDPRVFHREAKTLAQAGHQVTLICPHDKKEEWVDGVQLLGFPRTRALLARPLNWLRILSILRHQSAEVYHFHDPDLLPLGLFLSRRTGKPVIYDCHEHYVEAIMTDERIPRLGRSSFAWTFDLFEKAITKRLAAVIVVDHRGEKRFSDVGKVIVLRNLPWQEMFEVLPSETPRQRQVLHLGQINQSHRNVSILIEMLSLMHNADVSLVLAGPIDRSQTRAHLETLIRDRQLSDRVRFVGRIPYPAIRSYLIESSVGLVPLKPVPRWASGLPTKTFEYMACRLPFVISDMPQPHEFVAETEAGLLVEPESAQAFADAVDFLLDHPQESMRLGENGRQAFLREYNWDKESQKLLDLYESLAKEC